MAYYTERHGMRRPVAKTYNISTEKYALLLHCCEKYYNNLAWKYPAQCPDGQGCCGIDHEQFRLDLRYEIQVERIIENSPLTPAVETAIAAVQEAGTRELLQEAILLHRSPYPTDVRDAVEKLWDAYERLKTYYTTMNKRDSANKIIADMAAGQASYVTLFEDEFKALTKIGNDFRIRHHETDKVEITDVRYYDYFFNRCLSLIALAIQYLQ